eukprot:3104584-Prymnesium_polylepis.1
MSAAAPSRLARVVACAVCIQVRAQQVTKQTFDDAFTENFKLMERDNFPRFLSGDEFASLLREIEAYSTEETGAPS